MVKGYKQITPTEIDLANKWRQQGKSLGVVAALLGRSKEAVRENTTPAIVKKKAMKVKGRPPLITDAKFEKIRVMTENMVKVADCRWEVTLAMVKRKAQFKGSLRTIGDAFRSRGMYFRNYREKLRLTAQDVLDRKLFAQQYMDRRKEAWVSHPHAVIDNKSFPVYLNGPGRDNAARRKARGSRRGKGGGLSKGHVKPRKTYSPGDGKSVSVMAAVIKGKIRVWHELDAWGGEPASAAYKGPLKKALRAAYPGVRKHVVLEDNDPAGYKSRAGLEAKAAVGITTLNLPKRSPDLNVLDYSLWSQINTRMREAEAKWPKDFTESRQEYKDRLRRTALALSAAVVKKAVMDMKRRLHALKAANGGYFEE